MNKRGVSHAVPAPIPAFVRPIQIQELDEILLVSRILKTPDLLFFALRGNIVLVLLIQYISKSEHHWCPSSLFLTCPGIREGVDVEELNDPYSVPGRRMEVD